MKRFTSETILHKKKILKKAKTKKKGKFLLGTAVNFMQSNSFIKVLEQTNTKRQNLSLKNEEEYQFALKLSRKIIKSLKLLYTIFIQDKTFLKKVICRLVSYCLPPHNKVKKLLYIENKDRIVTFESLKPDIIMDSIVETYVNDKVEDDVLSFGNFRKLKKQKSPLNVKRNLGPRKAKNFLTISRRGWVNIETLNHFEIFFCTLTKHLDNFKLMAVQKNESEVETSINRIKNLTIENMDMKNSYLKGFANKEVQKMDIIKRIRDTSITSSHDILGEYHKFNGDRKRFNNLEDHSNKMNKRLRITLAKMKFKIKEDILDDKGKSKVNYQIQKRNQRH